MIAVVQSFLLLLPKNRATPLKCLPFFCLRRSPDHGTVEVVVVVVVVVITFISFFCDTDFFIIFFGIIDVINSANFGIYMTSAFDKKTAKNNLPISHFPPVFDNFDLSIDLKIQF